MALGRIHSTVIGGSWNPIGLRFKPDESLVQNIGKENGVWTAEMTHAALQKTHRFHPNRNYMGWDFEMIDMELEEYE